MHNYPTLHLNRTKTHCQTPELILFSIYWRVRTCTATNSQLCLSPSSRRAVTEHQLMHDRGRTIQSLKRLIWLSSAIEGLHTAQTRSATFNPSKPLSLVLNPALVPAAGSPKPNHVQSLLRDFFNLYLTQLQEREPWRHSDAQIKWHTCKKGLNVLVWTKTHLKQQQKTSIQWQMCPNVSKV